MIRETPGIARYIALRLPLVNGHAGFVEFRHVDVEFVDDISYEIIDACLSG